MAGVPGPGGETPGGDYTGPSASNSDDYTLRIQQLYSRTPNPPGTLGDLIAKKQQAGA